jgi:hypothetical protein
MTDGVLVRGTRNGPIVLFALGGAGTFAALAVLVGTHSAGLWAVLAAIFAAVAVLKLPALFARRVYLVVRPTGFAVRDWNGHREFADADVTAVGVDATDELSNGVRQGMRRKATLTVADGPPVLMDYLVRTGGPDPALPLIRRLIFRLIAGARHQVASGQRFAGAGWALDREGFWTSGGDGDRLIKTAELSHAMVIDRHLAIWEQGHEQPSLRIPVGESNVLVLAMLLKERLAGNGRPGTPEEDLGGGLGRMLFERDRSWPPLVFALLIVFSLALAGVAVLMVVAPDFIPSRNPLLIGVAGGGVAVIVGLMALGYRRNHFACHQRGVSRTTIWGTRRLRYEDVDWFTYSAVRQYVHGVFAGLTVELTFVPRADLRGGPIKFQISAHGADQALDALRDLVARVMARDLCTQLVAGKGVRWTAGYVLAPEGLVCPASGLFGRPRLVPYAELQPPQMNDGFLFLFMRGQRKHFASIRTSSVNFFPGLVVLNLGVARGLPFTVRDRDAAAR